MYAYSCNALSGQFFTVDRALDSILWLWSTDWEMNSQCVYSVGEAVMPRTLWTVSTLRCCCCFSSSKFLRSMNTVSVDAVLIFFFSDELLSENNKPKLALCASHLAPNLSQAFIYQKNNWKSAMTLHIWANWTATMLLTEIQRVGSCRFHHRNTRRTTIYTQSDHLTTIQ